MTETFDFYDKWLGIPPEEQPADYYRLLGIKKFESDLDVIINAADKQMGHIKTFQNGPYYAESQEFLNEISAARTNLTSAPRDGGPVLSKRENKPNISARQKAG